jgi:hypothetical protein
VVYPKNALKYKPEHANRAAIACQVGLTDHELAMVFGVADQTIIRWRHQYPEFAEALKSGKSLADDRVERSLYHRAIGYTYEAEELFLYKGKIIREKVVKHVPPDVTATIFWLKNRRRNEWRDVQKHEVGPAGAFDSMTEEELRASIMEDLRILEIEPPKALAPPQAQGVVPKK